jgi:putative membrane-bound dehydrogenase-like protein
MGEPVPPDAPLPFRVPRGYLAERVAAPPLVKHPMFACFDDRGRLFVAGSTGHNLSGDALRADPPDWIRCLEDTDGDGRFDKATVFADRLTYPQGVLWHDGAVFTASPPSLWRLEDADGDGVADRRTELVTGFPFTGIADDLHGPRLGPDGRLYWGVGRFDYAIRKPGGPVIRRGQTPLIMRCRTDGDDVEVFSAAMGNPVGVAFSDEGEPFACGTFLSPEVQGAGLRDALIHCAYGGLYSVRDRELKGEKRTGDLLPPLAQLGVAAGSGLARARGAAFGDGRLVLYPALFNLRSVPRFTLERDGATFRAREEPFLESDETDFHPTDVVEDADGSLLVVDTGGWFRSCPTSQVDKPRVLGGIYRVRRADAARVTDPRGRKIDWDRQTPRALARLLDDPRPAVRDRAAARLVRQGEAAIPALREVLRDGRDGPRLRAVWVLAQVEGPEARAAVRKALDDPRPGVRQAAAAAAGLNRDAGALARLREMVGTDDPPVRREAATALGRLGRPEAVPTLLNGLRDQSDRFLEHALIYALIEIGARRDTRAGLNDPSPSVRRGTLFALDQMGNGRLTLGRVIRFLDAPEPEVRQAALQVVASHPRWAAPMADRLSGWLARGWGSIPEGSVRRQLLAFAHDPAVQLVMADALGRDATPAPSRKLLLDVMAAAPLRPWPSAWAAPVRRSIGDPDDDVARRAVGVALAVGDSGFAMPLTSLARDGSRDTDLRVAALDAAAPLLHTLEPPLFDLLVAQLRLDLPPLRRLAAARALGRAPLNRDQILALSRAAGGSGPMVLPRLLPAFERTSDPKVGSSLVASLNQAPGLEGLTAEALARCLSPYPAVVREQAEPLFQRLEAQQKDQAARLAVIEPHTREGDASAGRDVFFSPKAACSTCHTVRAEGGHVGPDLSRIGAVRNGRDLLEAILFPSASFARGYEPFTVSTVDGRVYAGIIARESADAIVLVVSARIEVALPRAEIDAIQPARVSVMPQGLDANLSRKELTDLVAFLRSLN